MLYLHTTIYIYIYVYLNIIMKNNLIISTTNIKKAEIKKNKISVNTYHLN
jgi:hypothetical protein